MPTLQRSSTRQHVTTLCAVAAVLAASGFATAGGTPGAEPSTRALTVAHGSTDVAMLNTAGLAPGQLEGVVFDVKNVESSPVRYTARVIAALDPGPELADSLEVSLTSGDTTLTGTLRELDGAALGATAEIPVDGTGRLHVSYAWSPGMTAAPDRPVRFHLEIEAARENIPVPGNDWLIS